MKTSTNLLRLVLPVLLLAILPVLLQAQSGHELISKKGLFSITFPGEPEYSAENVETAVGDLIMHTYLHEASTDAAYMVAYIDYPADMVEESDNDVLLYAALEGALNSWGIELDDDKMETTWRDNYKGYFYKASNNDTHAAYEVILRNNRLYQIAILQYGKSISKKTISSFFDSFKLLD